MNVHKELRFVAIQVLEELAVPIFVLDPTGRVIVWNKACAYLTNINAGEMVGTRNHWQALYATERPCLADILLKEEELASDTLHQINAEASDPTIALQRQASLLRNLYQSFTSPEETGFGLRAENWCDMPRLGKRRYLVFDAIPIYDETGKLMAVSETIQDLTPYKSDRMES